jgi:L-ascorbate metabolism protein UlaG (beta-lactamase superfamily)
MIFFTGCTAIKSTVHTIGRSLGAVFRSPDTLKHKIQNPVIPDAELAVLWVGHATCLIQIDDKFILTDPNFTSTVGQFSKRLVEPGIEPQHLPQLDAVIISHLHIDHLSPTSLELIETKVGHLLVPEQGLVYIPNFDFTMQEIKIWRSWQKNGLKITLVPAIHNGWRYGLDDAWMKKSFGGYVIEYNGKTVYFAGDTAYDDLLNNQISERFGRIDLALIPVAPIHPREYSKARHTSPREAVQMMLDMNAQFLIPIHYDTYPESIDVPGEAADSLYAAITHFAVPDERVVILDIGQQRTLIGRKKTARIDSRDDKKSVTLSR